MIPILEFKGWITLLIGLIILSIRLIYCMTKFDYDFTLHLLCVVIITSTIWGLFFYYKSTHKFLLAQFAITIFVSICLILFIHMRKYKII